MMEKSKMQSERTFSSSSLPQDSLSAKRRRNRAVLSCVPCHERHTKCSRTVPCSTCIHTGRKEQCHYVDVEAYRSSRRPSSASSNIIHQGFNDNPTLQQQHLLPSPAFDTSTSVFWDEFPSSGSSNTEASSSQSFYTFEVQEQLKQARCSLPLRLNETKRLLTRAICAGEWIGCSKECGYAIQLETDPPLRLLLDPKIEDIKLDNSLSIFQAGDASRLCLIIAMILAVMPSLSDGLVSLCYDGHALSFDLGNVLHNESSQIKFTRQKVMETLELHFRTLLRIAATEDAVLEADSTSYESHLDTAIRAALVRICCLKNEARFEEVEMRGFMSELSQLVRLAKLNQVDSHRCSSTGMLQLEPLLWGNADLQDEKADERLNRRRRLFYEYLIQERLGVYIFNYKESFGEDEIETRPPLPVEYPVDSILFKVRITNTLHAASNLLRFGPNSYAEIENVEGKLQDIWTECLKRKQLFAQEQLERVNYDSSTVTEARHQITYHSAQLLIHRLYFFDPYTNQSNLQQTFSEVQRSRLKCIESAESAVDALEALRFLMAADELMHSFQVSWLPARLVVSLLLFSIMAVHDDIQTISVLFNNRQSTRIVDSLMLHKRCLDLATRTRRLLSCAPPNATIARKAVEKLDQIGTKVNMVLEGLLATYWPYNHLYASHDILSLSAIDRLIELCNKENGYPNKVQEGALSRSEHNSSNQVYLDSTLIMSNDSSLNNKLPMPAVTTREDAHHSPLNDGGVITEADYLGWTGQNGTIDGNLQTLSSNYPITTTQPRPSRRTPLTCSALEAWIDAWLDLLVRS